MRGPHFDGHEFVSDVARLGASAAVVSNPTRAMNSPSALALLQVQDTLTALHKLATNYRRLMPPTTRVIAVTGSSGKTTTKELIASVLADRFNIIETTANHNNQIGVPLNLLRLGPAHDFGVFELGTSRPGEIAVLASMVRPDIGVITNVGLGHVEFFGDEAGVAGEKSELLKVLPRNGDGLAVLNADDRWCAEMRACTNSTVVTVGIENFADIRASEIKINGDVKFRLNIAKKREDVIVRLKTLGRHQIYNALQAAAVGYFAGLDLDEIRVGLENARFPGMRMEPATINGVRYVNDCYNANPVSMKAALQMIRETPCNGRKIAVLGDMLELGTWTNNAHLEIGTIAAGCGLSWLVTVGESARLMAQAAVDAGMDADGVLSVATAQEAAQTLGVLVHEEDLVLIKGSRRLELERILEDCRNHYDVATLS
ncbi:MAG TPA: UDP-N-acetylmuramoyl-tripeptide--D-alanyl-D-alanine ligase [Verrucomicrobiae bacterium]|nr:UDP-N-acetylmuramoyl-tripeptide--D-alanyl-D-alanine ligase [Verrucomicrobiae bacterium]